MVAFCDEAIKRGGHGIDGLPTEDEVTTHLQAIGYEIRPWTVIFVDQGRQRQLSAEVRWRARPQEAHSPAFLQTLVHQPGCSNWNGSHNVQ